MLIHTLSLTHVSTSKMPNHFERFTAKICSLIKGHVSFVDGNRSGEIPQEVRIHCNNFGDIELIFTAVKEEMDKVWEGSNIEGLKQLCRDHDDQIGLQPGVTWLLPFEVASFPRSETSLLPLRILLGPNALCSKLVQWHLTRNVVSPASICDDLKKYREAA